MKSLKSLISIRQKASPDTGESSNQGESSTSQITVTDSGYEESKNANGSPLVLSGCLDNLYQGFKERCRKDEYYQRKIKEPTIKEQEQQRTELLKRNTIKEIKEEEIEKFRTRIDKIDKDISSVKSNPEAFGLDVDNKPKAQFYLGLVVLLPITLYLIVFYISASYSAFFKDFETSKLAAAIFDAQAFTNAFNEGWLEAIFVCTIPFTFMGLGYLVHMFQKEGKKGIAKIISLYLVTFVFDSILAYLIENKIYEFEKTPDSPLFNLAIAFTKVEFWGIIFAGFVVYIIWGLVFDFVMKEFENIDKINSYIKGLKQEKDSIEKCIKSAQEQINIVKSDIAHISGKISELQGTIDSFVFSNREYLLYYSSYLKGWMFAISKELHLTNEDFDQVTRACKEVAEQHLVKNGIGIEEMDTKVLNIAV